MRSFTIVKINSSDRRVKSKSVGGRFQSSSPASAAKKAGSSVCRLNNINSSIKFKIAIRETTQGSSHKIFAYKFSRVRNPITVMRSGKKITYEFETKVKSLKRSARHDGTFDTLLDPSLDLYGIWEDAIPIPHVRFKDLTDEDLTDDLSKEELTDDETEIYIPITSSSSEGVDLIDVDLTDDAPDKKEIYSAEEETFNTQYVNTNDKNYSKKQGICRQQVPYYCGKGSHSSKQGRCARQPADCLAEGPIAQSGSNFKYGDLNNDFLYKAMSKEERAKLFIPTAGIKNPGVEPVGDVVGDEIDEYFNDEIFHTGQTGKFHEKKDWCRSQVPYYCGKGSHQSKLGRCARKPADCLAEGPIAQSDNYKYEDLNNDYLYKAMHPEERLKLLDRDGKRRKSQKKRSQKKRSQKKRSQKKRSQKKRSSKKRSSKKRSQKKLF